MKATRPLLVLLATIGLAHAGGFGGPPPFSNGSPLQSGTDGVYQAVASAVNLSGIFSFTISNGAQTTTPTNNGWVFFVDGQLLTGLVTAYVSTDKVDGILDSGFGTELPTDDDGTVPLPLAFVIPGNAAAGSFSGDIDLNSPIVPFSGEGQLEGIPGRVDQIVFITEPQVATEASTEAVTVTPITIPGSSFEAVEFTFRGTRVTTSP